MYERLLRLPVSTYDRASVGELLSRVTYDVNQIMEAGLQVITIVVKDGVLAISLLAILLYTDWQLAMFCALLLPGVAFSMKVVGRRQRRLSLQTQDSMGMVDAQGAPEIDRLVHPVAYATREPFGSFAAGVCSRRYPPARAAPQASRALRRVKGFASPMSFWNISTPASVSRVWMVSMIVA